MCEFGRSRRPAGEARGGGILDVLRRRATTPAGMDRPSKFAQISSSGSLLADQTFRPRLARPHLGQVLPDGSLDRLVEADRSSGDFTQGSDARLVVALHQGCRVAGELTRSLGGENHQGEAVWNFFQAIFNGYASQSSLRGKSRGSNIGSKLAKSSPHKGGLGEPPCQESCSHVVTTLQIPFTNSTLKGASEIFGDPCGRGSPQELIPCR